MKHMFPTNTAHLWTMHDQKIQDLVAGAPDRAGYDLQNPRATSHHQPNQISEHR